MAVKPDDARVAQEGGLAAGPSDVRPSPREDARLVAALRAGKLDAFAELVSDYQGAVFNLALRLVRDREDARDITQDVLIKAYGAIPATDGDLRLWAWLYRITVNACWDHLRAASRRPRPSEDAEELASARPADDERAEAARLFSESLAALSPRQQAALLLKDVHGLDHADIAETLGITKGSSKVLLFHARHSFRRAYRALVADEPLPEACRLAERAVAASVGGRLTASQRRTILRHARTCADCRNVVEKWQGPHAVGLALALPLVAAPQLFGPAAGVPAAAGPGSLGAGTGFLGAGTSIAFGTAGGASMGAGTSAAICSAGGAGAAAATGAGASGAALGAAGGFAAKMAGLGAAKAAAVVIAAASVATYTGAEVSTGPTDRPPHRTPAASAAVEPDARTPKADSLTQTGIAETAAGAAVTAHTLSLRPENPGRVPAWLTRHLTANRATAKRGRPEIRRLADWSAPSDRPAKLQRGQAADLGRHGRKSAERTGAYAAAPAGRHSARLKPRLDGGARPTGVARVTNTRSAARGWLRRSAATQALAKQGRPAGRAVKQGRRAGSAAAPGERLPASVALRVKPSGKALSPILASGETSSQTQASRRQARSHKAQSTAAHLGSPSRVGPDMPATPPQPEGALGS